MPDSGTSIARSPRDEARDLADRLAVYRFTKLAAHQLRLRLHDRHQLWPANTGQPRRHGPQMRIGDRP